MRVLAGCERHAVRIEKRHDLENDFGPTVTVRIRLRSFDRMRRCRLFDDHHIRMKLLIADARSDQSVTLSGCQRFFEDLNGVFLLLKDRARTDHRVALTEICHVETLSGLRPWRKVNDTPVMERPYAFRTLPMFKTEPDVDTSFSSVEHAHGRTPNASFASTFFLGSSNFTLTDRECGGVLANGPPSPA